MRRYAAFLLMAVWALAPMAAQRLEEPETAPSEYVHFLGAEAAPVSSSKPSSLLLDFRVAAGHHINAHQPGSPLLIPTDLRLNVPTDLVVGNVRYPSGREFSAVFAPGEKFSVYSGPFSIHALVSATRAAVPGRYRVHGELRYQACSDRACFPPQKLPVNFDLVVARTRPQRRSNPPQSPHIHG